MSNDFVESTSYRRISQLRVRKNVKKLKMEMVVGQKQVQNAIARPIIRAAPLIIEVLMRGIDVWMLRGSMPNYRGCPVGRQSVVELTTAFGGIMGTAEHLAVPAFGTSALNPGDNVVCLVSAPAHPRLVFG
jgi:hypothetical protein